MGLPLLCEQFNPSCLSSRYSSWREQASSGVVDLLRKDGAALEIFRAATAKLVLFRGENTLLAFGNKKHSISTTGSFSLPRKL